MDLYGGDMMKAYFEAEEDGNSIVGGRLRIPVKITPEEDGYTAVFLATSIDVAIKGNDVIIRAWESSDNDWFEHSKIVKFDSKGEAKKFKEEFVKLVFAFVEAGKGIDVDEHVKTCLNWVKKWEENIRDLILVSIEDKGEMSFNELLKKVKDVSEEILREFIEKLKNEGYIFEPKPGRYRLL